jgi:hypothetical protein
MNSQVPTTGHGDEATRIFGSGLTAVFVGMLLLNAICY